jgi:hypothetical protein
VARWKPSPYYITQFRPDLIYLKIKYKNKNCAIWALSSQRKKTIEMEFK